MAIENGSDKPFVSYLNLDLHGCSPKKIADRTKILDFAERVCCLLQTKPIDGMPWAERFALETHAVGYTLALVTEMRDTLTIHFAEMTDSAYVNWQWMDHRTPPLTYPIFDAVRTLTIEAFGASQVITAAERVIDNPKVVLRDTNKYGLGLYAVEDIAEGEIIAVHDGVIYEAETVFDIPNDPPDYLRDHSIQFERNQWRDSIGFARFASHSCEPNCGVKDRFKYVAMRAIKAEEEISFDYAMTEDSEWKLEGCRCDSSNCRGIITGYRDLPEEFRRAYQGYISEYLLET